MKRKIKTYWNNIITREISIAPLVTFRLIFGLIMFFSLVRFAAMGWIHDFYIKPEFFFSYYGFDWVKPLGGTAMYIIFSLMAISSLFIAVGYKYRLSTITFFILFTYIELLDKTYYLNHYYFVSIIGFLMIFLPAGKGISFDAGWKFLPKVPAWTVYILIFQISIVYFYAGLAKINYEWLIEATPLKIWLPARGNFPIIGNLLEELWVAYFFSWAGMLYDLSIPFLLLNKKTRFAAYFAVIGFHVITWLLFPIGMFPFIMIGLTVIFFPAKFHQDIISFFIKNTNFAVNSNLKIQPKPLKVFFIVFLILQLMIPLRFMVYPGNLFWTEQGYRFSWRVMLMEKTGMCDCMVKSPELDRPIEVANSDYLTKAQEHMMATQPDMILQYAHYLKEIYENKGVKNPEVYANCMVSLQGKRSQPFIDQTTNLAAVERGFKHKKWILPLEK